MASSALADRFTYPVAQLNHWLNAPAGEAPREVIGVVATVAATPWMVTLERPGHPRRQIAAYGDVAVDLHTAGGDVTMVPLPRRRMIEHVTAAMAVRPAAQPTEPPRRAKRSVPALIGLMTEGRLERLIEFVDLLSEQREECLDALGAIETMVTLRRDAPGRSMPQATLIVFSCGEHGHWAVWLHVDIDAPWDLDTVRVQRVDRERLGELVERTIGDLADPASDEPGDPFPQPPDDDGDRDTHASEMTA
jgi:hypothetical protein